MRRGLVAGVVALVAGCPAAEDESGETTTSSTPMTTTTMTPASSSTMPATATGTGLPPGTTSAPATTTTGAVDSTSTGGDGPIFDVATQPDVPAAMGCVPTVPVLAGLPCDPADVTIVAPFDMYYDCLDLADVPGVPINYGGVTFAWDDPDLLLIGGSANTLAGQLYSIGVARDADCHVIGFTDAMAQVYSEAAYNDGGVAYGPDDVLFLARWPVNEMGQLLPGSVVTDRVDLLPPIGVGTSSIAGLTFVPPTYPGEGELKVITWPNGEWFTVPFSPAGDGTFDLGAAVAGPVLPGGPEGIVYVSGANDGFDDVSVLVSEWSAGNVAAYLVDAAGQPDVATRQDFIVGLTGAEGALIDPTSGDFLFSTFGGGDRLIVVSGFVPNPPPAG